MENNELQQIWKQIDGKINIKSSQELRLLLNSKARQMVNRILLIGGVSMAVSIGVLAWLTVTLLQRWFDTWYVINNIFLGVLTIISLISGVIQWKKLQIKNCHQPFAEYLENRVKLLSGWLKGKYNKAYIVLLPLLYCLTVLSIHVYFEEKLFIEVLHTEESVTGLLIGAPIGLFVAFYSIRKIRKYQIRNLEFLNDLLHRIRNVQV